MIVTAFNPETQNLERTYLAEYTPEASATLNVKNTNGFATAKAILIGKMGQERAEIMETDGVTPNDVVSLDGTTGFAHNADDPVYLLRYNKIRFYRSATIDGTYALLGTVDIDVDNEDLITRYDHAAGVSTDYYKVKYYNDISLEESNFSDAIRAEGYDTLTIGKVIDAVARRVRDREYNILTIEDYLDIAQEVNDDLITQRHKPYKFLKKVVALNTVAGQNYIAMPADLWKFDYLVYSWTVGGVTHSYKIEEPLSQEDFIRKYDNTNWIDSDELIDIALDEFNERILIGPGAKTSQTGVVELHYYQTFNEINSIGDIVQTPNTLIYRYKMMAEFYAAKAETDRQYGTLSANYESKYGNEIVKMQRVNRVDVGTPRSFAAKRVPRLRKRYVL